MLLRNWSKIKLEDSDNLNTKCRTIQQPHNYCQFEYCSSPIFRSPHNYSFKKYFLFNAIQVALFHAACYKKWSTCIPLGWMEIQAPCLSLQKHHQFMFSCSQTQFLSNRTTLNLRGIYKWRQSNWWEGDLTLFKLKDRLDMTKGSKFEWRHLWLAPLLFFFKNGWATESSFAVVVCRCRSSVPTRRSRHRPSR